MLAQRPNRGLALPASTRDFCDQMVEIRQTLPWPWLMARLGAARGALSGKRYFVGVTVNVAVGAAAYLGLSAMMAVPVWTTRAHPYQT
jgi:hypothetical protein